MALAGTSEATTLRAVDAMLAGLASCTGAEGFHDRLYTEQNLFPLVFPAEWIAERPLLDVGRDRAARSGQGDQFRANAG